MSTIVSVCRVSRIPTGADLAAFHAAHREIFGDCVGEMTFLRDPEDPNQAALVGKVNDLERLRAISRTPEGDAMMRRFGFIEQLSYFIEAA